MSTKHVLMIHKYKNIFLPKGLQQTDQRIMRNMQETYHRILETMKNHLFLWLDEIRKRILENMEDFHVLMIQGKISIAN